MKRARKSPTTGNHRKLSSSVLQRRKLVLEVSVRRATARRSRHRKILSWTGLLVFWGLLVGGGAYFAQNLLDRFFFENPDYNLVHMDLDAAGVLDVSEIPALTGIQRGMNIFRIDLGVAEKALEKIPEVTKARVHRQLPDTVAIQVKTRAPVAWLLDREEADLPPRGYLVDHDGGVYAPRAILPDYFDLPVITGISLTEVESGDLLRKQDLREAIHLLTVRNFHPTSTLEIRTVDISKGYALEVVGGKGKVVLFETGDYSRQLDRLEKLLEHCRETGRQLEFVNLIPKRNTPVRFVAAIPRAEPVHR